MAKSGKTKKSTKQKTRCHKCRRFFIDLKRHSCPKDRPKKPPAVGEKRKKRQPTISTETYNKLWDAYREQQNVSYCARQAGCNMKTAERYINGPGAPEAMMHPIAARWARVQSAAIEEEDMTLAAFRRKTLHELVMPGMKMLDGERSLAVQELMNRIAEFKKTGKVKGKMPLGAFVKALDKLTRLGERMLGASDLKTEQHVGGLEHEFEGWTEEELIEYSTTGRKPKDVS
jgi:hypothetical protein